MYRVLTVAVCSAAILLRLVLCWVNPPGNAFDNHYEPISLILQTWHIPDKNACFQCYQPPVFYYSSALVAKALYGAGMNNAAAAKALQFLNCLFGILTIIVIWLILKRLRLSNLSRCIALMLVCFLPRHIYMSAIHSNECLSYLGVAVCLYLVLLTIDKKLWLPAAALTGLAATLAIFVKYTAFVVIPVVGGPLAALLFVKSGIPRTKAAAALCCALVPPLLLLGTYCAFNVATYGKALPWNDTTINTSRYHPRDPEPVSFISFTPWQYLQVPLVMPGQVHSFWTLIYSGMWADTEPRFTYYTDQNYGWWLQYTKWLAGKGGFPQAAVPLSETSRRLAQGLLALGLVPLAMIVAGLVLCLRQMVPGSREPLGLEAVKLMPLPVLLAGNAAGIILLTLRAPVYSSMKASYFLISLPAYALFAALAMQWLEKRAWLKGAALAVYGALAVVATAAVLRIVLALRAAL